MSNWFPEIELKLNRLVLIRADASPIIGTGHIMRCLALANQAIQTGWRCVFVVRDPAANIIEFINLAGHEVKVLRTSPQFRKNQGNKVSCSRLAVSQIDDAHETVGIIRALKPKWVIVDHYALDLSWFSLVKDSTESKILVIDDLVDRKLTCDLLLNQNLGADEERYSQKIPLACKTLLGPRFALLRHEFSNWRKYSMERRKDGNIQNILITLGGADSENYTLRILEELSKSKHAIRCNFHVILGGYYNAHSALTEFIDSSALNISVSD